MEIPTSLRNLAQILKVRKHQSKPYSLLLTSAISLTPEVLINICNSDNWDVFRTYLRGLGQNDRINVLTDYLGRQNNLKGYRALTHLIREGYFSTILTTNLDFTLEDTLLEYSLRSPTTQVLVVDRDKGEYIADVLDSHVSGIRIIKLHGSLRERVLPATFPDFFELPDIVRDGLKRYLNQDIVIVGSLQREDDITRSLTTRGGSSIYYVLPRVPSQKDNVVKVIRARSSDPRKFVIAGPYGHFESFFTSLESLLISNPSTTSQAPD